jgi:hypothetical protein
MRMFTLFSWLVVLAGCMAAQDSNFPLGPQYLITSGSPLFLRPIATPSLSLSSSELQPQTSTVQPTSAVEDETFHTVASILDDDRGTYLLSVYYGLPRVSVVEIASPQPGESNTARPHESSLEVGVVEITSRKALREGGYGVILPEARAHPKSQAPSGRRVYTNADVERLRPHE